MRALAVACVFVLAAMSGRYGLAGDDSCAVKAGESKISVFAITVRRVARERGIPLAKAIDLFHAAGVRGVDIDPDNDDLPEFAASKLKPVNLYLFPRMFAADNGEADRIRCFKQAARFGITRVMVVPPDFTKGGDDEAEFKKVLSSMKRFVEEGRKQGLVITVEDYGGTGNPCSHMKYLKRLLDEIPGLCFALDTGNLYYAGRGESILEMAHYAKGRIAHVHLKDMSREDNRKYVTLGLGAVPNEELVKGVASSGYDGWYTFENLVGDACADAVRQKAVLERWLGCVTARAERDFRIKVLTEEFIVGPVTGHVHASTLLPLKDGGYLAAWFEGTKEGAGDVAIKGSRRKAGRWGPVRVLAKVNPDSPHWNPVLWRADDGRIVLFFKVGRNCSDWRTYFRESRDEGERWTEARELVPGEVRGGRGPVRNKCLRLANGRWLAGASREIGRWRAFADISDDDGKSWRASPEFPIPANAAANLGVIQPTLWSDDGGVHAFLRATDGWIWRTDSTDGGETWREIYRSPLQNVNSGIDCIRASNGLLYLVLNGVDPGGGEKGSWGLRNHLELRASDSAGTAWRLCHVLADDGPRQSDGRATEFSYPAIREPRPGVLAVTFTWNRRQIRFVELRCGGE